MRQPEPIGSQHQQEGFDCGNGALNRWLQQRALANERQGVSRTVLLCPDEGNAVIAYACLSAGAFVLAEVPGALRCNMPDPLPFVVLGRLAVDRCHQGQGPIRTSRPTPPQRPRPGDLGTSDRAAALPCTQLLAQFPQKQNAMRLLGSSLSLFTQPPARRPPRQTDIAKCVEACSCMNGDTCLFGFPLEMASSWSRDGSVGCSLLAGDCRTGRVCGGAGGAWVGRLRRRHLAQ